jgi:hypothetical protein
VALESGRDSTCTKRGCEEGQCEFEEGNPGEATLLRIARQQQGSRLWEASDAVLELGDSAARHQGRWPRERR